MPGLPDDRCLVMGVVNVTPDSFSDGGRWLDADTAIRHGIDLVAEGADLVDVGGESTRPGALRIDGEEERRRVIPVIRGLVAEGISVSVDTMRASTARESLEAGASIINDVSGGRADPEMMALAAQTGSPIVLMHWREHSAVMQQHTLYEDIVEDITRELIVQVNAAVHAGVDPDRIILDPGLGFSKTGEQNWAVLAHLDAFVALRHPLLVAASRKRFLGELLTDGDVQRPTERRDDATAAISALAASAGAWCVRVHEPAASADAVRVAARLGQENR
ncbi:dihydropteroate synthase [Aeromicrobium sp.]|uniref:dihydropteroate synthase n=1 Tax=Aeromicrobium sp. TaxID=1871063 RepID=UPI003C638288